MDIPDMYRKFAYKAKLKITKNPEKLRDIIQDQLPFLIGNNRKDELKEVETFLRENSGFSEISELRRDFYEKIITHCLNNDNVEMFREYAGGIREARKDLVSLLIDKNNLELVKIFCESPFGCDRFYDNLEEKLYDAAKERNYEALNNIFKFENDFTSYVKSLSRPYDSSLSGMINFQNVSGHETVSNFVSNLKSHLGTDLLNNALHMHSKELVDYTTNLGRFQVKTYIAANLVENNQVQLLKTILMHPNINIEHLKRDRNSSIHPEVMLLDASRTGSVDVMKFAVEFNGETPNAKTLEDSLKFCVNRGSKEGIDYLLTEFKEHYNIDLLNKITQVLVEQNRVNVATYIKDNCPEIEVDINGKSKKVGTPLDDKINRLRDNAINSNANKNTLTLS